ncbi:MAG: signal peptidase I [bacterium]|nr:signal peptidase I [bacterium]
MPPKKIEKLFWVTGWIYDFSRIATVLLILGLLCHYFFFTVLVVRGKSMLPNYTDGQVLMINKITYRYISPARGDVVAMYWPGEVEKRFIKRIVALPGETVMVKDGKVYINGVRLEEDYLDSSVVTSSELTRTLQSNEYFVFGDNRSNSSDSRAWGPVPKSFLIGKIGSEIFQLKAQAVN